MLSIRFVLSETVATVSLSAPATIVHIRHWAVNMVPAVGQTMQFGDNYLNGHLSPAATASIPCQIDRSRCPLKCQTGHTRRLAVANAWIDASCAAVDFSCYVCVVASTAATSNDRAGVRLDAVAARTATEVCVRDVRTADVSACGRRSARILEIRRLTRTASPRKFADADWRGSLA